MTTTGTPSQRRLADNYFREIAGLRLHLALWVAVGARRLLART
jgi:hypothetical protein